MSKRFLIQNYPFQIIRASLMNCARISLKRIVRNMSAIGFHIKHTHLVYLLQAWTQFIRDTPRICARIYKIRWHLVCLLVYLQRVIFGPTNVFYWTRLKCWICWVYIQFNVDRWQTLCIASKCQTTNERKEWDTKRKLRNRWKYRKRNNTH